MAHKCVQCAKIVEPEKYVRIAAPLHICCHLALEIVFPFRLKLIL